MSGTWYCAGCGRAWPDSVPLCPRDGTLARPDRVGSYRLEARIGSGGTGEVFRALDERANEYVAVKVLYPGIDLLPTFSAPLAHEHVATVREVGRREDGCTWVVTDLVSGSSLRRMLEEGPLTTALVVEIGRQMASGLHGLHQRELVHGDLKPDNVMIERRGNDRPHVRLVDFGCRSSVEEEPDAMHSGHQEPQPTFTPSYLAPELIQGQPRPAPPSDVYALGCTLHELATGHTPFDRDNVVQVLSGHLEDQPPPLPLNSDGKPHPLAGVVARCLAKDPTSRPRAEELSAELARVVKQVGPGLLPRLAHEELSDDRPTEPRMAVPPPEEPAAPAAPHTLPSEIEIEKRLNLTFTVAADGSRVPHMEARQIASTLRQALAVARELDHLLAESPLIDVAMARDLLKSLALGAEQLELWFSRHTRR